RPEHPSRERTEEVRDAPRQARAERKRHDEHQLKLTADAVAEGTRVLRLVESELAPSRKSDRGEQSEAFVADRAAELDSLSLELGNGRMDVVAHEIELVATGPVSRVRGELSGWEGDGGGQLGASVGLGPTAPILDHAQPEMHVPE